MLVLASTLAVGGGERVLAHLLGEIHERGIPVSLLLLKEAGPVGEELAAAGIPVRALGLAGTKSPRALSSLLRAIREDTPSVLYIQDHHDCLFWGRLAAALAGFLPALSPVHSSSLGALRSFRLYNRLLLGLSPNLVTLGDWQEAALRGRESLTDGFWVRIPNPVTSAAGPVSGKAGRRKEGKWILGTVAALRPEKRQDRLLRLAAHMSLRLDLELWLIGDGELREELEREAARLGIAGRVRFLGRREDVPALLEELDLFLLTSEEEALPLSVLEAIQAGVPVAACAKGAIPDLLADGERGLLLHGDDPELWSRRILDWLEKPPTAAELSLWSRDVAEAYSLTRFSRSYLRLLEFLGLDA